MANAIASLFLLAFIGIWGVIGVAFIIRGLWLSLGLESPTAIDWSQFNIAKNLFENPQYFDAISAFSRVSARLMSF